MLIDRQIHEALSARTIVVEPRESIDTRIQPASLDVRLGNTFLSLDPRTAPQVIDPKDDNTECWHETYVRDGGHFTILPNEMILAATLETIELADTMTARIDGKSSLGRLGILVHSTAGLIDNGWSGPITLEISTVIGRPTRLYPGMPIGQLTFEASEPAMIGYAGKYVGSTGPRPSAFHRNWTGSRWI